MTVIVALASVGVFFVLLAYSGYRATTSSYRGASYLTMSLLFFVAGFFFAPLWVGVLFGPALWLILRPRVPPGVRWDRLRVQHQPPTDATVVAERARMERHLARGYCPACGKKNRSEASRCRACDAWLDVP
jgi:hypothetical protein